MATKSYSKHKEYKEYSSSGTVPYTDEQLDMIKSDLLPKGSKLNSLGRNGAPGAREYHYEYKEEKHPSGKYDRKDMRTVEEYTIPQKVVPKAAESSTYYYEREERELPSINTGTRTYNYENSISSTPGYSKVKSSKATKDLSQNVDELDSLLDDLQKDQERQLYKSGYTSDTAESTSFDYRKGVPKAPSSGYSTLKREERLESSSWGSSPPPPPPTVTRAAEIRQELYREEKTESRVVPSQVSPAVPLAVPAPVCGNCHHVTSNTSTLSRSSTPMNKVTTTVKTYTYEVPADQDPTTVPLPPLSDHERYVSTTENIRTSTNSTKLPASLAVPSPTGCQFCTHCNHSLTRDVHSTNTLTRDIRDTTEYRTHLTKDVTDHSHTGERIVYPSPVNETKLLPSDPHNGHGPYGPTSYKYSETTYASHNSSRPTPSPGPFPRPTTPSPGNQQTPKRLDDLLADFPEARFPTQPDGLTRRKVEVSHESSRAHDVTPAGRDAAPVSAVKPTPIGGTRNVAGSAVYYPPGHVPFEKKDSPAVVGGGYEASSAMQAGGGRYAHGRGMYEYESGSKSKEKHSETKTAVPICLPLCCAMPCVIM